MKTKLASNTLIKAMLTTALACCALFASENITSYSSPVTVNDFLKWGDTMWIATSGGLRAHNLTSSGAHSMLANSRVFPDLHLTALCRDPHGNLWIGSRKGYLYRMTPRGQFTTYSNYKISDWGVTSLYYYDGLIIVGSNRGVSLFDPVKGVAVRNAARIANFTNPRVNTIEVFGDALFLGCDEGVAFLDSLSVDPLSARNFYYPGIWKTHSSGPVRAFVRTFVRPGTSTQVYSTHTFAHAGDTLRAYSAPAAEFREVVFYTPPDSGWIMNGNTRWTRITPWGAIQKFYNEDGRRLWVGSLDGSYYTWEAERHSEWDPDNPAGTEFYETVIPPEQYWIGGMTLRRASRVLTAGDGNVWFLPIVPYPTPREHHGVYRFDGAHWHLYNNYTYPDQFGYIGDGTSWGGAVWSDGSLWAGTSGGSVKHIEPAKNTVSQLIAGNGDFKNVNYVVGGDGDIAWSKNDALARDSSGYLWVAVYGSTFGRLVCYDPRYRPVSLEEPKITPPDTAGCHSSARAHYRRFFADPLPGRNANISVLNVDADGRIFAYDPNQNQLTIFSHGGNPLTGGIKVEAVYTNYGNISSITAADDGTTYIAGVNGLRKVAPGSVSIDNVSSVLTNLTNIGSVVERDGVLWLGTRANGILRVDLGSRDSAGIWINELSGLPSNEVLSLALEKKSGRLWIVTYEGISRLDVGRAGAVASGRGLRAFPNVFSLGGSMQGARHITFEGLEARSSVSVYTVNGALVAKVEVDAQQFRQFTGSEWRAAWTPRRDLVPGTYIAVAKPSGKKAKIILKP